MTHSRTEYKLWYKKPAAEWNEALPIGNGRLGGMVFGGVASDRVQLNEGSVWYGGFVDRHNPDARAYLPAIRRLLFGGDTRCDRSGRSGFLSWSRELTTTRRERSPYQPLSLQKKPYPLQQKVLALPSRFA
jgi:hypothetical protein